MTFFYYVLMIVVVSLGGCTKAKNWFKGDPDRPLEGKREQVMLNISSLQVDQNLAQCPLTLPVPRTNKDWPQTGGTPAHNPGALALAQNTQKIWEQDIGAGSGSDSCILSAPILHGEYVYTLDARSTLRKIKADTGKISWSMDTAPEGSSIPVLGGGVAFYKGTLYVTTAHAELLAVAPETGEILWRKPTHSPVRSAPTIADGRVFVLTINNRLEAFDSKSGDHLWSHVGFIEAAGVLGTASPAVQGGVVIVPYSSGEVYALRAENGHLLWSQTLGALGQVDSLSSLAHVRAHPVIDQDLIFLISHNGEMTALKVRSGQPLWKRPIAGIHPPVVAGGFVFVLDQTGEVIALSRNEGHVKWIKPLNSLLPKQHQLPHDSAEKPLWTGPLLAGNTLLVFNTYGQALRLNPETGETVSFFEIKGSITVPPIVANERLYVLTDEGELSAYK